MSLLLRQSAYDGTSDGSGASLLPSSPLRPQSPPRPSSPPSLQLPPPPQQSSSHVRRRRQRYARPPQHRRVPQPLPLSPPPPLLLLRGRGAHTARPRRASVAALRIGTDRHRRDSIATRHTTHSSSSSSDAETSVASGSDDDDTHEHESACSDNNNNSNNNNDDDEDDEDDAATRGASVLLAQTMTSTSSSSLTLVSCSSRGSVSVPLPPPPPPVLRRLAAAASASALSLSSSLSSSSAAAPRLRVTRTNAPRHNATVAAATTATTTARQRPPYVLTLPVTSAPHRQAQQQRPQQHATPSAHVSWSAKQLTSHRRCLASTHASCPLLGKHNTRIIATATAATAADAAGAAMTRTTRTATRAYAARVVHHEGDDDNDDDNDSKHATLLPLPRLRVRAAYARHGNDHDDSNSSSRRTADIHSSDDDDGSNTSSNSSNSTCSDDDDDATAAFHFFTPLSPCPTSTAPRFDVVACAAASTAKRTAASAAAATMAVTALPSSSPPRRQEQQTCVTWPASCDDDEDNDDDNSNSKGDSNDSSERDVHVVSSTDAVTKQRQPTPPPQPTSSCAYALLPLPRFIAHVDDNKTAHAPARHAATAHYATLPSLSSLTRSAATTTTTAATATTTTVAVPHGGVCRPASHHAATPVRPLAAATATRDAMCDARVHAAVADASSGHECDGSGAVMAVAVVTGNARTRTQRADRASDHNNDDDRNDNGDACDGRRVVPGGVAAADERLQTHFAYASLQGHRTHQEDHVLLLPSLQLPVPSSSSSCEASALLVRCFGVFDGHGGDVVARLASRCFAEHFLLALQQHYATYNTPLPQQQQQQQQQHDDNADSTRARQHRLLSASLVQTLLHVDVTIRDVLPPTQHGAGATACVAACYAPPPPQQHTTAATTTTTTTPCRVSCAATDSRCRVVTLGDGVDSLVLSLANLGDSRAVLGRVATRALLLETRDHRLARNAAERARVLRCGGVVEVGGVDGVLDVTRGLGDYRWKSAPAQWWAACAHEDNKDNNNDNDNKDNDDDVQTKATRRDNDADTRTTCGNVISNIADVYECDVHAGEFLLIASDGVWDYVSSIAAVHFIADTLATLVDGADGGDDASGEPRERLPSPSPLCVDNDNDVVSAYVRDEGNGNVAAETTAVAATHLPSCTPRLHANDHDDNDATVQRPAHVPLQQMLPYNVSDMAWPWLPPASSHRARTHDTNMTTTTTTPLPRLCLPPCAVSGSTPPSSPSLLAPLPSARSVASDASDVAAAAASTTSSSSSSSTSDTPRSTDGGEAWRDTQTPRDMTATRAARHETQQQQHRQHARRPPSPAPAALLQCAVRRFTQYILHECGSRDNITVVLVYFARGSDTNDDNDTQ